MPVSLISALVVTLALAFTGPAFAGDVTNATDKASCDKAGGVWERLQPRRGLGFGGKAPALASPLSRLDHSPQGFQAI